MEGMVRHVHVVCYGTVAARLACGGHFGTRSTLSCMYSCNTATVSSSRVECYFYVSTLQSCLIVLVQMAGEEPSAALAQLSWQSLSLQDEAKPPQPKAVTAPSYQQASSSKPVHKVCIQTPICYFLPWLAIL